jgi:diguanylate cyclase (GGDEF)-like protein
MLDVDHFKKINDSFGHASGDAALRRLAGLITGSIRSTDIPGRMGGEEFAVLLPDTDSTAAFELAERLRKNVEVDRLEDIPGFTVSIGLASSAVSQPTIEKLLAQADAALYAAKSEGRNRVIVAPTLA